MHTLIQQNVPLADKNWFRTGGPARYYCEPQSELEFQEALQFAHKQNLEIFVLGEGANILVSDEGFDGLVIRPRLDQITVPILRTLRTNGEENTALKSRAHPHSEPSILDFAHPKQDSGENSINPITNLSSKLSTVDLLYPKQGQEDPELSTVRPEPAKDTNEKDIFVTAGSGVTMHDLILYCLEHNILGLEEFSGIPGTVGGSVYINLHYFQFLLEQFIEKATIIDKKTGLIEHVTRDWFAFGYDYSTLHSHEHYLINATFKLRKANDLEIAYARGRRTEIIRHRESRYPKHNTCGSFFRNFHDHEVTLISSGKKMIYVAYYLDKIGVKGALKIGDAQVSYQHANMLVNQGNATSQDLINLARTMQELVFEQFGVLPQTECELVGFKEYPLHLPASYPVTNSQKHAILKHYDTK